MTGVLPEEFLQRFRIIVPPERFDRCLAALGGPRPVAFRVNTLKTTADQALAELQSERFEPQPVEWLAEAFLVPHEQRFRLVRSAAAAAGRIYVQGLSSMLAATLLDPRPTEEVLDLAAAPGGKTLHMAAMMQNRGRIAAVDVVRKRIYKLRANLRAHGATIVETYLADGRSIGRKTPDRFDRVLLDAPCSAESRFRSGEPASWSRWSMRKIRECARKQKGLLRSAVRAARPGGTVLYCTCSFAPEENEAVVQHVLDRFGPAVEVESIVVPIDNIQSGLTSWGKHVFDARLARAVRILPNEVMDGFFLCRLAKLRRTP